MSLTLSVITAPEEMRKYSYDNTFFVIYLIEIACTTEFDPEYFRD